MAVTEAGPTSARGLGPATSYAPHPLPRYLDARFLVAGALVLSALSLLVCRSPTADVWAWMLWGRQIAHLHLVTTQGPQFKPLPVAVAAVLSPLGSVTPTLWILLARAGGLLALGGVARIAYRSAGWLAAVLSVAGVLVTPLYVGYLMPYGMSEPLLLALLAWAVDQHLRAQPARAFWLMVAAALLRPEVWPFLLGYALWCLWKRRMNWPTIAIGLVLVPAAWLLPEWWGSGNPFRSGEGRAVAGAPSLQRHPGPAVISQFGHELLPWVEAGALLGLAYAAAVRDRLLLALGGLGIGWLLVVAGMAEAGKSSGISRYLIAAYGVAAVLSGIGWTVVGREVARRLARLRLPPAVAAAVVVAVVAAAAFPSATRWWRATHALAREVNYQQGLTNALPHAIQAAGGPGQLLTCGQPWAVGTRVTQVAWLLNIRIDQVGTIAYPALPLSAYQGPMFQSRDRRGDPVQPTPFPFYRYREVGRATSRGAEWTIITGCGVPQA